MDEHAEVGGKFVTVTNHTTYSFGIDDQEFMTAFECEEPADFMHLMLTLRETEASKLDGARHADLRRRARARFASVLAALDGASAHARVLAAPASRGRRARRARCARSPRRSMPSTTKNAIASPPGGVSPIAAPTSTTASPIAP